MPKVIKAEDNEKREYIISKILEIIGINTDNDTFLLSKMDLDIDKQNKIYELEADIKKYYKTGKWSCFNKPIKRKWLSIIKYLCKEHNKTLDSTSYTFNYNTDSNKSDTIYKIY